MDTARAAKRTKGVENVYLVYRRTKRYMPADEEELSMAEEDGVVFKELLAPVALENGLLHCEKMQLGALDASGRQSVSGTGEKESVPADTVIVAVGEKVPTEFYQANGLQVDERGRAYRDDKTLESSQKGVYLAGDGLGGPATVVEGIRDAQKVASAILGSPAVSGCEKEGSPEACFEKKGILVSEEAAEHESKRCLNCAAVCENCVDVCPNRANISIEVPGMKMAQIIHVDYMCNECGNCKSFCPYASAPYLDKFTLFANEADMADSKNQGFTVLDSAAGECRVRFLGNETTVKVAEESDRVPKGLRDLMAAVIKDYFYLI